MTSRSLPTPFPADRRRSERALLAFVSAVTFAAVFAVASLSAASFRIEYVAACAFDHTSGVGGNDVKSPGAGPAYIECPVSTNDHFPFSTAAVFVDGTDRSLYQSTTAQACVTFQSSNGSACGAISDSGSVFTGVFDMQVDNSAWQSSPNEFPFLAINLEDSGQTVYGWFLTN